MPEELIYGGARGEGIFLRGHGCEHCKDSGHPGLYRQTVVAEIVNLDAEILALLREHRREEARTYWLTELRGMTYLEHARHLIASGVLGSMITEEMLAMPIDEDIQIMNALRAHMKAKAVNTAPVSSSAVNAHPTRSAKKRRGY